MVQLNCMNAIYGRWQFQGPLFDFVTGPKYRISSMKKYCENKHMYQFDINGSSIS